MATTASLIDSPASSPLPPLYAAWMTDLLVGAIPTETKSTCGNCAMAAPAGTVISEKNAGDFFDPDLKCCTFTPTPPNFLVGRILSDIDPALLQFADAVCAVAMFALQRCLDQVNISRYFARS